ASGLLLGIGSPSWSVPVFTVLGLLCLTGVHGTTWRGDVLRGAIITSLAAAVSLRWIPAAWAGYAGDGGVHTWLFVSLVHALPGAVALGTSGTLRRRDIHPAIALGMGMMLGEASCRVLPIPLGFTSGLAQAWPLLGPAGIAGRPLLAGLIGAVVGSGHDRRSLAQVGLLWLLTVRIFVHWTGDLTTVGIVETGVDGFDARRPSTAEDRAAFLLDATQLTADWVLTPEGAWPWALGRTDRGRAGFSQDWSGHPPVLLGGNTDGGTVYNSVALIEDGQVTERVDKRFLIPVAEGRAFGMPGRYAAGSQDRDVFVSDTRISVLVCWEDVLPLAISTVSTSTDVLALPSSDVWLGPMGQAHHLDAARFAAVTTGRWAVRATPTGQSVALTPTGRVAATLDGPGSAVVTVRKRPLPWIPAALGTWLSVLTAIGYVMLLARKR
ncbi:MAG: apolipoprotein N-acyltransferase, partial [Myxococcota bacterium]